MNKKLTKVLTVPTLIAVILTATAFGFRPILHPPTASKAMIMEGNPEDNSAVIHVSDAALPAGDNPGSIGADGGLPVRTESASGLQSTTFDTLVGTVTVNLPDDLAAGDTISGTVIAEAKNKPPRPKWEFCGSTHNPGRAKGIRRRGWRKKHLVTNSR
jgi:hypothetical protein